MNLLIRLILTLLGFRFRNRLKPFDESCLSFRVLPTDLDINRHMTNSRYFSFMDLGRIDLMFRCGVGGAAIKKGWGVVLAGSTIRFRRSLKLGQRFLLKTRLVGWDDKWLIMEQKVEHEGMLIAHAYMRGAFVSKGKTVPTKEIFAIIGIDSEPHVTSPILHSWNKLDEAIKMGEEREYDTDDRKKR